MAAAQFVDDILLKKNCAQRAGEIGEHRGEAVIEVKDSGPGVAPEDRDSIFNLFFRGRTKAQGGVKSSGLGLAIARELVEAHGGRITVVAGASGGHFRVTLPRRSARTLADAA